MRGKEVCKEICTIFVQKKSDRLDTTRAATLTLDTCLLQNRALHNVYVENQ